MYFQCPLTPHFGLIIGVRIIGYQRGEGDTSLCFILINHPGARHCPSVAPTDRTLPCLELVTEQQEKLRRNVQQEIVIFKLNAGF